jgi:hypothetical protein
MSSQAVKDILVRAIYDDNFLQAMLNEPQSTLAEYEDKLTAEERHAVLEGAPTLLRLTSTSPDDRAFPRLPNLWPKWKFRNHAESPLYRQLETLATERVQRAAWDLNDVSESLGALMALDPVEREQRITDILRRWEGSNDQ